MKVSSLNRRDFLKLFGIAGLNLLIKNSQAVGGELSDPESRPNFIILLLDTLSACNMSLYGYPRKTTPAIEDIAQKSTVFHHHYAAGNFTTPNTASLLTGTHPWTHRAFSLYSSALDNFNDKHIFKLIAANQYSTIAYTHNIYANYLLNQFTYPAHQLFPIEHITLTQHKRLLSLFGNDYKISSMAGRKWLSDLQRLNNSVFLGSALHQIEQVKNAQQNAAYAEAFPIGTCETPEGQLFVLEDAINWIHQIVSSNSQPFLGYFHLLPPHEPYKPRQEFYNHFSNDQFHPLMKKSHFFTHDVEFNEMIELRNRYDEYVAYADAEVGRLYQILEQKGILDSTYFIITADHGQLFERGIHGHITPTLYEPLLHIPLIIHAPGQKQPRDVWTPTSIIDIMPTLLHLSDQEIPTWCEGQILPGFDGIDDPERPLFAVEAKENAKFAPIKKGTLSIIRWPHKLIHYRGYPGFDDIVELYNLENDPDELDDISLNKPEIIFDLKQELDHRLALAEQKQLET